MSTDTNLDAVVRAIDGAVIRALRAFDCAVLGAGVGLLALKSLLVHRYYSAASEQVLQAPTVSISGLPSLLYDGAGDQSLLVFVRGEARPMGSSALFSEKWSGGAVLVEHCQTCMYNSAWGIVDWILGPRNFEELIQQYQSKTIETIPFGLREIGYLPFKAYVAVNIEGSTQALPLTKVYHHLKPVQPSFSTCLRAFTDNTCPVGIWSEERVLPVGKMVSAIGICRMRDGVPEITSSEAIPYFLSGNSKEKIEAELTNMSNAYLGFAIFLGLVALGILGYSGWRNWNRWRFQRSRRQWLRQEDGEANETATEVPDGQMCVICLRRRRRSAFIPCGHHVCCSGCANLVVEDANPICPICRRAIHSSVLVLDH